jgi:hypothetical protein
LFSLIGCGHPIKNEKNYFEIFVMLFNINIELYITYVTVVSLLVCTVLSSSMLIKPDNSFALEVVFLKLTVGKADTSKEKYSN